MNLDTPISALSRVGKTTASRFKHLGITTAGDLLYYFPFRYEDFRHLVPIAEIKTGEAVTVLGAIELIASRRTHRKGKMITEAIINDETGSLRAVWFNQPFLSKTLHTGDKIFLSGTIKDSMLGPELMSPSYERYTAPGETTSTNRLVPIYPLTGNLTEKQVRFLVKQVLPLASELPEWLPATFLEQYDFVPLSEAVRGIHFPVDETDLKKSTERLKFDELFLVQLQAELNRQKRLGESAPALVFNQEAVQAFVGRLPFTLTKSQKVSAWEILQDIGKTVPMNRLLSGDVGSGKTVVAAIAIYNTILNNHQAALMVPTEILAEQHYRSLTKLLPQYPIALLTGSHHTVSNLELTGKSKTAQKADLLKKIVQHEIPVVVGTHALLSESSLFKKLGLVIVDEQHRFGVEQRKIIKEKGKNVHFLSMTATPIPRSLALMLYGDLDVSIINELPVGRKKILTRLVEPANRDKAYAFIRQEITKGRQVFVVCPLIEGSGENVEKKSVLTEYKKLSEVVFPDLRVGYLHGKLKAKEKDEIMGAFARGETDILVSTSVVEVGVDVPNASVMMIEGAEKFGLAQLHQFRGRVGRSSHQSYCFLFTDSDSPRANERLQYFEAHHDGFALAEKDLEIRGPGEVYGVEQSGMQELRLATLRDQALIKKARETARVIADEIEKYPFIQNKVEKVRSSLHLE